MQNAYSELLNIVLSDISPVLLGDADRAAVQALADRLPLLVNGGFEFPLGKTASEADFLVSANADAGEHMALHGCMPGADQHPFWRQLDRFCEWWTESGDLVANIWLEFDRKDVLAAAPLPNMFTTFGRAPTAAEIRAVWAQLLPHHPFEDRIEMLLERLPEGGRVSHAARMIARPETPARICLTGLSGPKWADWLDEWGIFEGLDYRSFLEVDADNFILHFDISAEVHSRLGIEIYVDHPRRFHRWKTLLEWMIGRGICLQDKAVAMMRYWKLHRIEESQAWPKKWLQADAVTDENIRGSIAQLINHVKVVLVPNKPVAAKGYLFCGHRWAGDLSEKAGWENYRTNLNPGG